jgi:autotransporter-associated beta strand protein
MNMNKRMYQLGCASLMMLGGSETVLAITAPQTFTTEQIVSSIISQGTGANATKPVKINCTIDPTDIVTLNASNTYTAGTLLQSGHAKAMTNASFGTGPITFSNVSATSSIIAGNNSLSLPNAVTLTNNAIIDTDGNDLTMSGAFSGSAGLSKISDGLAVLSGANTYSGATTVKQGTLAGRISNSLTLSPQNVLSVTTPLLSVLTPQAASSWTQYSYTYEATGTTSYLKFQMRNDDDTGDSLDSISVTAGAGNLLTNGGFESGLTGWTQVNDAGSYVYTNSGVDYAQGGVNSYVNSSVGQLSTLYQTFATTPSTTYTLTFYYLSGGSATAQNFIVNMGEVSLSTPAYYLGNGDQTLTSVTAPVGTSIGLQDSPSSATPHTLTLSNSADATYATKFTGAGNLAISNAGHITTLSGTTNNHTGATTLQAGTLAVSDKGNLGTATTLHVLNGATLKATDNVCLMCPIVWGS